MTIDLFYHIKDQKLSPEQILEKVRVENLKNRYEVPYISDELKSVIMSEPDVLGYDLNSKDLSKLDRVAKKYYVSLNQINSWLRMDRDNKISCK
jgi:hypothetical protein